MIALALAILEVIGHSPCIQSDWFLTEEVVALALNVVVLQEVMVK